MGKEEDKKKLIKKEVKAEENLLIDKPLKDESVDVSFEDLKEQTKKEEEHCKEHPEHCHCHESFEDFQKNKESVDEIKKEDTDSLKDDRIALDDAATIEDAKNDNVLQESLEETIVDQLEDGLLVYQLRNLWDEKGKIKDKKEMKKDPPTIHFFLPTGEELVMVVTENVARDLKYKMKTVENAYYGIVKKKRLKVNELKDFFKNFGTRWKEISVDTLLLILILIVFIISLFS